MGLILSDYLAITYHFLFRSVAHFLRMAFSERYQPHSRYYFLIQGEKNLLCHAKLTETAPEKNAIIPDPRGWPPHLTSSGTHARSSDPKRGIGQFFISRRKEDI